MESAVGSAILSWGENKWKEKCNQNNPSLQMEMNYVGFLFVGIIKNSMFQDFSMYVQSS